MRVEAEPETVCAAGCWLLVAGCCWLVLGQVLCYPSIGVSLLNHPPTGGVPRPGVRRGHRPPRLAEPDLNLATGCWWHCWSLQLPQRAPSPGSRSEYGGHGPNPAKGPLHPYPHTPTTAFATPQHPRRPRRRGPQPQHKQARTVLHRLERVLPYPAPPPPPPPTPHPPPKKKRGRRTLGAREIWD